MSRILVRLSETSSLDPLYFKQQTQTQGRRVKCSKEKRVWTKEKERLRRGTSACGRVGGRSRAVLTGKRVDVGGRRGCIFKRDRERVKGGYAQVSGVY